MPYIKPELRTALEFLNPMPSNEGELNFAVSHLVHGYVKAKCKSGLSYAVLNSVIGVLECAKLEVYRTIAAPYEDVKREENGSVSDLDKKFQSSSVQYTAPDINQIGQVLAKALSDAMKPPAVEPAKQPATEEQSQVLSAAPVQVSSVTEAAKQPATSNKRRPAKAVGTSPMAGVVARNVPVATATAEPSDGSRPRNHEPAKVSDHVRSVWDEAANGNGENNDDI